MGMRGGTRPGDLGGPGAGKLCEQGHALTCRDDGCSDVRGAECVMLNKGPYVAEAVTVLDHVLTRMQEHQVKKTPQLRALHMRQQEKGKKKESL